MLTSSFSCVYAPTQSLTRRTHTCTYLQRTNERIKWGGTVIHNFIMYARTRFAGSVCKIESGMLRIKVRCLMSVFHRASERQQADKQASRQINQSVLSEAAAAAAGSKHTLTVFNY